MNNDEAKKLAAMLDRLCADGSEHITVTREGDGSDITEQTENCTDCCKGDLACSIPTLHKGLDGE